MKRNIQLYSNTFLLRRDDIFVRTELEWYWTKTSLHICICHQIPSSVIIGDDVIINLGNISHPSRVVDVRVNNGLPQVLVSVWVREASLTGTDAVPQLNCVCYSNVMGMVGVVQSNWIVWVQPEIIVDFAFIFYCDTVQNGIYKNSHGMSNAFYTHHRLFTLEGRNLMSVYEINNHIPFVHL